MTLTLDAETTAGVASFWIAHRRELVAAFGGTSMLPTIAPGQQVLLRCGVTPEIGEVAVFRWGDRLAVHRVVARARDGSWTVTWGDANPFPDEPFEPERLLGTIAAVDRDGVMQPVPPAPTTLFRRLLLAVTAPRAKPIAVVLTRIRWYFRIRSRIRRLLPLPHPGVT